MCFLFCKIVCYSLNVYIIIYMFYYGIYVVVIPELQCYSLNFVYPMGAFHSLVIFVVLQMLFIF